MVQVHFAAYFLYDLIVKIILVSDDDASKSISVIATVIRDYKMS